MKSQWVKKVGAFFAAVYLISALLWIPVLISGEGLTTTGNKIIVGLLTFVPSLLGILFVYMTNDHIGRQDFWRRMLRWPRGRSGYLAATLCLPVALGAITYLLSSWVDGRPIQLIYASQMSRTPELLLQFLVIEFFFGAVSEELGWRGFALDQLQSRWNALTSSLILGLVWALWHLPAFFVPGMAQYEMREPIVMALFIVNVIIGSVLQTWGYNSTGRSILVGGILMHFLTNATLVLTNGILSQYTVSPSYPYIHVGINLLAALLIVVIFKPRTLTGNYASPAHPARIILPTS